jgi:hypothetical protein
VANAGKIWSVIILYIEKINMQILTINVYWDSFLQTADQKKQITLSIKAEVGHKMPQSRGRKRPK